MADLENRKPLKGVLTIMVDENVTNWSTSDLIDPPPPPPPTGTLTTILLEVQDKGKTFFFTDSYTPCCVSDDGSSGQGWASDLKEEDLCKIDLTSFLLQNANSLNSAILQVFPGPGIPIITKVPKNDKKIDFTLFDDTPTPPECNANLTPKSAGSTARFKVEIRFAKTP
jgi:hypothetical protein